jgi:hypothetical protein
MLLRSCLLAFDEARKYLLKNDTVSVQVAWGLMAGVNRLVDNVDDGVDDESMFQVRLEVFITRAVIAKRLGRRSEVEVYFEEAWGMTRETAEHRNKLSHVIVNTLHDDAIRAVKWLRMIVDDRLTHQSHHWWYTVCYWHSVLQVRRFLTWHDM